jgi:hypothetical protein
LVYAIETHLKIHQENLQAARKLDRVHPLEDPGERKYRRVELARAERLPLSDALYQELHETIGNIVAAARWQPQLMSGNRPIALEGPAKPTARHANLRANLLDNPDQSQAAFVKLCRVHPNTVRRTRRELEEARAIPFLAHRHAQASHHI